MAKNERGSAAPTRRRVLRGSVGLIGPLVTAQSRPAAYAYVGCYTTPERNGRGDGIHAYRMDQATGAWSHIQHVGNLVNPSFLITSKDQRFLYSVHGDEEYATAFAVEPATGHLKLLNQA